MFVLGVPELAWGLPPPLLWPIDLLRAGEAEATEGERERAALCRDGDCEGDGDLCEAQLVDAVWETRAADSTRVKPGLLAVPATAYEDWPYKWPYGCGDGSPYASR